jgi:hypothetical protein
MNDPMRELPPVPPYDYYMTLENGDDYGCWSSETMRSYARAAIAAASQQAEPVWVHVDHHGDARVTSHDLPVGDHNLFAAPPVQQEPEPFKLTPIRMRLCPTCGNKRCPKATNAIFECTGSNEPGQAGSVYAAMPVQAPVEQK